MKGKVYVNSEVCQKCANCCKRLSFYVHDSQSALRASWLNSKKVTVKKMPDGVWMVTFHIPCKELVKKDGVYSCRVHDGRRPSFCRTYPNGALDQPKEYVEEHSKFCPIIKERVLSSGSKRR